MMSLIFFWRPDYFSGTQLKIGKTHQWRSLYFHNHETEVIPAPNQLLDVFWRSKSFIWILQGKVGEAAINPRFSDALLT